MNNILVEPQTKGIFSKNMMRFLERSEESDEFSINTSSLLIQSEKSFDESRKK